MDFRRRPVSAETVQRVIWQQAALDEDVLALEQLVHRRWVDCVAAPGHHVSPTRHVAACAGDRLATRTIAESDLRVVLLRVHLGASLRASEELSHQRAQRGPDFEL